MCTAFSAGRCVDRRHRHLQPALASVAQGGPASAVRRSPRRTAEALRLGLAAVRGCRRVGGRRVAGDRPTNVLRPRALRTATRLLPAGAAWKMRSCGMADAGHISSAHRPGCGGEPRFRCGAALARAVPDAGWRASAGFHGTLFPGMFRPGGRRGLAVPLRFRGRLVRLPPRKLRLLCRHPEPSPGKRTARAVRERLAERGSSTAAFPAGRIVWRSTCAPMTAAGTAARGAHAGKEL